MRDFVVFYAWQSDTLQRHNRFLIRMALEEAAKRISHDASVRTQVRIDSDTEGVLGQPPITDTILEKIESCDVFAPDFTFVATTPGGKLVPNPNVMLEYGYALRARGYPIMLAVMNTAYGFPEKLPFDMGHLRHPMRYNLGPTATKAERRTVLKDLSVRFENVLRQMIDARPPKKKTEKVFAPTKSIGAPAFFFKSNEVLAEFGILQSEKFFYRFESEKAIFLRLFPAYEDQPIVGRAKVKATFAGRKPYPMSQIIGGLHSQNTYGSIIFDPQAASSISGMTQGFASGELWGLSSQPFHEDVRTVYNGDQQGISYISMIAVEKLMVRALTSYVNIATSEYGLRSPFFVEAGATGLLNVFAGVPSVEFPNGELVGPFRSPTLSKLYAFNDVTTDGILDVLRQFFDEFYDFADCSRSEVLSDGHVAANGLPPRT